MTVEEDAIYQAALDACAPRITAIDPEAKNIWNERLRYFDAFEEELRNQLAWRRATYLMAKKRRPAPGADIHHIDTSFDNENSDEAYYGLGGEAG